MNLVLFSTDELSGDVVRLTGRRAGHIRTVHRAAVGDELTIGVINGRIGRGTVLSLDPLEMRVALDREPPAPVAVTLVLALPRPKVMNRVIAAATSMGVKRIFIINAWRVEKSYWKSPRLSPDNLHAQILAGLEQAVDTMMPVIEMRRLFRPFVENELASIAAGSRAIVAHPHGAGECPHVAGPVTLAIGPEGGFIDQEIASFTRIGFEAVSLGPRILRVETAMAALIARIT